MIKSYRLLLIIVSAIVIFCGIFLLYATLIQFRPPKHHIILQNPSPNILDVNVPLTSATWNIGYAGLGQNMDLFYFGGNGVRDTKTQTQNNLDDITKTIKSFDTINFILLQNVDFNSSRSHYKNQLIDIENHVTSYQKNFAINYFVNFIPFPIKSPYGRVFSGIVTMYNRAPGETYSIGLPASKMWPKNLFLPFSVMLVNRFSVVNSKELVLINIHLVPSTISGLRKDELDEIKAFVVKEFERGNYVIVGGDWGQLPPGFNITNIQDNANIDDYSITNIPDDLLPSQWQWVYDANQPTNRLLNQPFIPGKSFVSIFDFFLLSPNIKLNSVNTLNQNFRSSNHNPVIISYSLIE